MSSKDMPRKMLENCGFTRASRPFGMTFGDLGLRRAPLGADNLFETCASDLKNRREVSMKSWKLAALGGAVLMVGGVAATQMPVVHGQEADSNAEIGEPADQVVQMFRGSSRIGVTVRDVEGDGVKDARTGVVVDDVTSGGPADKAGVKAGDAIVEFDGERVRSVRQFTRLVQETPTGRKIPAVLSRAGQHVTVSLTPERGSGFRVDGDFDFEHFKDFDRSFILPAPPEPPEPPEPPDSPRAPRPPAFPREPGFPFLYRSGGRLGITVEDLSDGLSTYFGVKHGALVRSVADGSAGAKAGLKAGDVITAVNGSTVDEPSDVSRALDRLDDQAEFTLEVVRDKRPQTLKGKLEPRERVRSRSRTVV
jgi:membrane-associated protease RseP (regulator of RpoE activity)